MAQCTALSIKKMVLDREDSCPVSDTENARAVLSSSCDQRAEVDKAVSCGIGKLALLLGGCGLVTLGTLLTLRRFSVREIADVALPVWSLNASTGRPVGQNDVGAYDETWHSDRLACVIDQLCEGSAGWTDRAPFPDISTSLRGLTPLYATSLAFDAALFRREP
ncbi:unnamed protein product [Soboliphyme baturini]|uniref:Transmembrane protein n=1 Tax=Soboliphyme baturini TaxID=241478 RepID=A0A183IQ25_9BILA|nr:unnamed protein product [Soboliphyme baturini]